MGKSDSSIEKIEKDGKVLAIRIKKDYDEMGLKFLTEDSFGLQMGVHIQKKGFLANAHKHIPFDEIKNLETQEVFFIQKGEVTVGLYDNDNKKIIDLKGKEGDTILINCTHDLKCIKDSKFVEIKQGPYRGKSEKEYID